VSRTGFEARWATSMLSTCRRQMQDVIMQIADVMKLHTKTRYTSWQRQIFYKVA
jgi:hypothetical protein